MGSGKTNARQNRTGNMLFGALLVIGALVVLGTWISDDESEQSTDAPAFESATPAQVEKVRYFLEEGFDIDLAYTAPADGGGHFVAARFSNAAGYVGLWWLGGEKDAPGMTLAVDHIADEACSCPWVETTQSPISMDTPPARELQRFVEGLR